MHLKRCPNCGAPLSSKDGVESCGYCGVHAEVAIAAKSEEPLPSVVIAKDESVETLCGRFIADVRAWADGKASDDTLPRAVEAKLDIPAARVDEFRREIMNYVGALAVEGKKFKADTNQRIQRALTEILHEARAKASGS